jgi:hypothetical protein
LGEAEVFSFFTVPSVQNIQEQETE